MKASTSKNSGWRHLKKVSARLAEREPKASLTTELEHLLELPLYVWPAPDMKAERWRYEILTNFKETLDHPPSKHDPRFKLLEEFRKSEEHIKDEIAALISRVGNVDDGVRATIKTLCEQAVTMWVEFGTLRYRTQVIISAWGVDENPQKARSAKSGSLKLIVAPELRRWGNWKGESLATDITAVVAGKPDILYEH